MTIEDWPDVVSEADSGLSDIGDEPIDSLDRDPEYIERPETTSPSFDPNDEPELTEAELRQLLEISLGDLANDEWIDMRKSLRPRI